MQTSPVTAYIVSTIVLIVMFIIAFATAQMTNYKPDHSDVAKRRVWFWLCCILTPVFAFCINYFKFYQAITVPTAQESYILAASIGAGVALVLFILLGLALSKSSTGKLASWF